MLKRLFMVVSIVLMVSLLAGCQQYLEEALGIINELLDSSSNEAEADDQTEQDVTEDEADSEGDVVEEEEPDVADDSDETGDGNLVALPVADFIVAPNFVLYDPEKAEPFDDRLRDQGYTLYTNPIGMPLRIPYQWILVGGESEQDKFTGLYCFDMPTDTDNLGYFFDYYHMGNNIQHNPNPDDENILHETRMDLGDEAKVVIQYGLDEYENTCAHVNINYQTGSGIAIAPIEEFTPLDASRERTLPSDYDEVFAKATSLDNFHTPDGRNSVKEAMYNDESLSLPLYKEIPEIFLYDSYMIHEVDNSGSSGINVVMCTDIFPHIATDKHLELLGNYNANIDNFEVIPKEDNTSMLKAATIIDFSFNDEFGTGSWSGSSYFYRYENDDTPFSEQSCMATDMTFSTDIIQ